MHSALPCRKQHISVPYFRPSTDNSKTGSCFGFCFQNRFLGILDNELTQKWDDSG